MERQLSSELILDDSSDCDDDIADDLGPIMSFGFPPLRAELVLYIYFMYICRHRL
jgi:hypothetical protein